MDRPRRGPLASHDHPPSTGSLDLVMIVPLLLAMCASLPSQTPPTLKPPSLLEGDTIGLVAPASPLEESLVERAVEAFRRHGYGVKLSLGYRDAKGYLAGEDGARAAEIDAMFRDDDVKAIVCLRGGYGSPRLLDRIDYDVIRAHPKILVGYSDITALLNAVHTRTGLVVFHGPMAKDFSAARGPTEYTERYFWECFRPVSPLFSDWGRGSPRGRGALRPLVKGRAEGPLAGGNLSVLTATLGTPYEVDTRGAILFLEEVSEKRFRIDRMLNHLRLAGKLAALKGVLLGQFTGCEDAGSGSGAGLDPLFLEYFGALGVPVLAGFPAGHSPDNVTLPLGSPVRLDATERKVSLLEAPTRAK